MSIAFLSFGRAAALVGLVVACAACGDDQDPAGAAGLWSRLQSEDYRSWARAPGFETRRPSNAAHGDAVDIFVNDVTAKALAAGTPIAAWPDGTLIVKDGYDGADHELVAAMEKRDGAWYWAEWSASGDSKYSGQPSVCIDCHARGDDHVRAFALPK